MAQVQENKILVFFWSKQTRVIILEAVAQRCSVKKVYLEITQNSQENTCARAQVFSEEFCEISKNTFSDKIPLGAACVTPNVADSLQSSEFATIASV